MKQTRHFYIDHFRFIAILLVTGYHLWRMLGKPEITFYHYNMFAIFERGYFGVDLFFFISGFSLAYTTSKKNETFDNLAGYKKFVMNRFMRLAPPYYVCLLVWNILLYLGVTNKSHGVIDNILHILFLHNLDPSTVYSISGVLWIVAPIMQFYLIFPLLYKTALKKPLFLFVSSAAVTLIINLIIIPYFLSGTSYGKYKVILDTSIFSYLVVFVLGILAFLYKDKILSIINNKIIVVLFTILIIHTTFLKVPLISNQFIDHIVTGSLFGFFMLYYSNLKLSENNTLNLSLSKLGEYSYSIFLYNYIFMIYKSPISTGVYGWFFYFILVFSFGILMYFFVEKPLAKLTKKLTPRM
ncbi:peptidoglycan/LPS O-acetylase OafA/YrhL [Paenibacillus sp. LBL]|uniref:acyltransferase family protein n=1 Tax=Paenibacillus sp. LBL TaxID=2940563 RepID=UPI0024754FC7|nr:acyltransferase [Paenibacillus sp. LBL]MDH6670162.1 peptidoglycan/LPS O-acetylase OafA/YrhL [Paenibacillus sp. LBL]